MLLLWHESDIHNRGRNIEGGSDIHNRWINIEGG